MTVFKKISEYKYLIPQTGRMRTEGLVFASSEMIRKVEEENSYKQVVNMATLPGIVGRAMAMPDIHYGYGFPIGGVAAFDLEEGVISPGGIGYDINCGVRLLTTSLSFDEVSSEEIDKLADRIYNSVPSGVGSSGRLKLEIPELKRVLKEVLKEGAGWAVRNGYGENEDLDHAEEGGCMSGADPLQVSERALERGKNQIGTLGAGNHFIEIQKVEEIFNPEKAAVFGLTKGQVTVMIHTGSRGFGYQVCDDYLKVMRSAVGKYGISLEDMQLVCAPFKSDEAKRYFAAMKCGANYAWANRQLITHWVREEVREIFGQETEINVLYDVCHNVGKVEEHDGKKLIVHRKGATRSFGPERAEIPDKYRETGQPVLIPGTMGTSSYVLAGTDTAMKESFGSTCHGAGRVWSRSRAKKSVRGENIRRELQERGITVKAKSYKTVAEEAPQAYKDVSEVVEICHKAGLSEKVAKVVPIAVVKG